MQKFKDRNGRDWVIDVDTNAAKRAKALAGVDLLNLVTGSLLDQLANPVTLVDVLYAVCRPQAVAAGVTDEQFGAALVGDTIESATAALLQGVVDFFPSARQQTLRGLLDKGQAVQAAAMRVVQAKIAAIDPEMVVAELVVAAATPGPSSTSAPASAASTPAP